MTGREHHNEANKWPSTTLNKLSMKFLWTQTKSLFKYCTTSKNIATSNLLMFNSRKWFFPKVSMLHKRNFLIFILFNHFSVPSYFFYYAACHFPINPWFTYPLLDGLFAEEAWKGLHFKKALWGILGLSERSERIHRMVARVEVLNRRVSNK